MTFRATVLQGAEKKYADMMSGTTPSALGTGLLPDSFDEYENKRNLYIDRLQREKDEYNQALASIVKNETDRADKKKNLKQERLSDRRVLRPTLIFSLIGQILLPILVFLGIRNDGTAWVTENVIISTGFPMFFKMGIALYITFVLSFVSMVWTMVVLLKSGKNKNAEGDIVGSIMGGIIVGAVGILVWRLLIVLLGYLVYVLVTPYGVTLLGIALSIVVCKRRGSLDRTSSKCIKTIVSIVMVLLSLFMSFFSFLYYYPELLLLMK